MRPGEFTTLLQQWTGGNKAALDALTPVVYVELRKLALARLRSERPDHTLQPTALINEAYIKLVGVHQDEWHSRAHFFSVASHLMREILVSHARQHRAAKRGGGEKAPLDEAITFAAERGQAVLELDEALGELARFDERKSRLIELKYFGGMESKEIGEILGISVSTVTRESRSAEAWLQNYLTGRQP
ncbi:MAG TPA: ECF-type sigma factor [Bryobacteraceae bacterium]|nr:ECF-type sigma factor [Bryobacteraceae bacterium]